MFFKSGAVAAPRESAFVRTLENGAGIRRSLLVSTILGAGAMVVLPGAASAQNFVYTGPASSGQAETDPIRATTAGTDTITITTTSGGTVTPSVSRASVAAGSVDGDILLTFGDTVTNTRYRSAVQATSAGSGSITLTGAGNLSSPGSAQTAVSAQTQTGAINIGGSGNITSGAYSNALEVRIASALAVADITINRSGTFNSTVSAQNLGSGKITIQGIGAVTSVMSGIISDATTGATLIDLTNNVSGDGGNNAIQAGSRTGDITIKTAAGVVVTTVDGAAIFAQSDGGKIGIDIGGSVTSNSTGISTDANTGATTITLRNGSSVTGTAYAIQASTSDGTVTVLNSGAVRGSIAATLYPGGTGAFTFNNSGTLTLLGSESNTGFILNNQSGGVLTGTGSFGDVIASGSTIRVGDRSLTTPAMGVMTMSSLTLAAGGKLEVRADASGVNDKLTVTGAANVTGATLRVLATPQTSTAWSTAKSFTVLSAGTLTGNFAKTETDYAFLKVTSVKSGNNIVATLERGWTSYGAYSTTSNQKSVSDVFDKFQTSSDNPLITKVTTLTIPQAPVAMSQLSGTGVAAARTQSFAASHLFNGAVDTEMTKFTGSAVGGSSVLSYVNDKKITKAFDKVAVKPAAPILDGRVWAQVLGGVANMKSDATNPSERATNFGLAAGVDTALTPNLRAGFALSGGQSSSKIASLATKADAVWGQAALYGVATDGDRYAKAALVYGYLTTETERTVTAFASPETAKGKFGANLFSTRLEVGQKFLTGGPVNLTPFFAFEPSWLVQNAYSETGAATIGLGYGKTTTRALPATLGMKFDADIALDGMRVTPSATLGWVHNFADTASLSPFFTALPGSTFTVAGAKGDRNLARTELNLEATPTDSTATFYANARADLGARTSAVRGTAGVMMRF